MAGAQLVTHSVDVAIPLESVTFELGWTGVVQWLSPDWDDQIVTVITGTPELGALFRDEPIREVRYQLGGAVAVPLSTSGWVDALNPDRSVNPFLAGSVLRVRSLGWNAHRTIEDAVTLIARGHLEVDPHPSVALALHVDVPLTVEFDGAVEVRPQAALTIAGRIENVHLVGVRAELVTNLVAGAHSRDANVLVEPFARLAWTDDAERFALYGRVALRLPLGPAFTLIGDEPVGYMGGSLELGALY